MKRLKFSDDLIKLLLNGQKDTTWRINDDKNISEGETLSLCRNDEIEFASAKVLWVKETTFGKLSVEDKEGHEKFSSDEELYKTYSRYYNIEVNPETILKVIKFKIIKE